MDPDDTHSDDSEILLTTPKKSKVVEDEWDVCKEYSDEDISDFDVGKTTLYNIVMVIVKLLIYLLTFSVVLGSGVVAKSSTFLMTSQLNPANSVSYSECNHKSGSDRRFVSHSTRLERISWYWALLLVFWVPEIIVFLRSLRILIFKRWELSTKLGFIIPVIFETLHTIGTGMLVYLVLPFMDVMEAAMITNALCIIPALFGFLSREWGNNDAAVKDLLAKCADVTAFVFQASALVWPFFFNKLSSTTTMHWSMPIAIILISFGWWENYVDKKSNIGVMKKLAEIKKELKMTRYFVYAFVSVWKLALFLCTMMLCFRINEGSLSPLYANFGESFGKHMFNVSEVRPTVLPFSSNPDIAKNVTESAIKPHKTWPFISVYVAGAQIVAAYLCYIFGKYACKISIQKVSFSLPVILILPTTMVLIVSLCGMRQSDVCAFKNSLPGYIFWNCPSGNVLDFISQHGWFWFLWITSQAWITSHIWTENAKDKLPKTDKLFTTPYYNSAFIDQSMLLKRRNKMNKSFKGSEDECNPRDSYSTESTLATDSEMPPPIFGLDTPKEKIPRVYGCATMWHETKEEMRKMLNSIYKMDIFQCFLRVDRSFFKIDNPDFYEYETHIYFDDAYEYKRTEDEGVQVVLNSYAKTFVETVVETSRQNPSVKMQPPTIIPTPYGGRLEWTLPGGTKLTIHFKNAEKIRKKKRWSQVMYMYYLLSHKLRKEFGDDQFREVSENVFLLALDGDIDFQPNALGYLLDLMRKDKKLGAACGRIHPTGAGPMVWYQKFEYAIGHWFQKSTEHMIGCVLCSPGCFSLFRGSALLDNNVLKRYTKKSEEPFDYIQYDQGEDRWLCTLLLKRGYRVEYSAASDAKTQAPEGFYEFFNQRRRWYPSTMINIIDLLMDYKKVVKENESISTLYMLYQLGLLIGSILGPGTIFLMLVGAASTAFKISQWTSFTYNLFPILIFLLICYFCKSETQLFVAGILSAAYALLMVAVMVAILLQISEDGYLAPSSLSIQVVAASFIIAAILHPNEFYCLKHGCIYYITIPSMYLLLALYSLFNMNNVGWGTRVGTQSKTKEEIAAEAEMKDVETVEKQNSVLNFLRNKKKAVEDSKFFDFSKWCCSKGGQNDEIVKIYSALEDIKKSLQSESPQTSKASIPSHSNRNTDINIQTNNDPIKGNGKRKYSGGNVRMKRDSLISPYWIEDKDLKECLKDGNVDFPDKEELNFWEGLINKYLKPDPNEKNEEMAKKLAEVRNKSAMAFLMLNAIFVVLVFLLQLEKDTIHIKWPFGVKTKNVTYIPETRKVEIVLEHLELEPIGIVFVGFFALLLVLQFLAMLKHRFGTLNQILVGTEIPFPHCSKDKENKESWEYRISLMKSLRKSIDAGNLEETSDEEPTADGGRKSISNLAKLTGSDTVDNLEDKIKQNAIYLSQCTDRRKSKMLNDKYRPTLDYVLETRRKTIVWQSRKSMAFPSSIYTENEKEPIPSTSTNSLAVPNHNLPSKRHSYHFEKQKSKQSSMERNKIDKQSIEMNTIQSGDTDSE